MSKSKKRVRIEEMLEEYDENYDRLWKELPYTAEDRKRDESILWGTW